MSIFSLSGSKQRNTFVLCFEGKKRNILTFFAGVGSEKRNTFALEEVVGEHFACQKRVVLSTQRGAGGGCGRALCA